MTDESRWHLLNAKRFERLIADAFISFRGHGIEPVLIKGWAAARYYPVGKPRSYSDIDFAVSASDFDKAKAQFGSAGSTIGGVDLHRELRQLDTLSWDKLVQNSELIDVEGTPFRVLSREDHLRVLCVHWLNDGGENKERLWDIHYAISDRPANFDWGKCLDVVSENRRRWVICTIGLAHRYLGLNVEGLPFAKEARQIPEWIVRYLEKEWKSGVELRPLHTCLKNPKILFQQIRKRIPPNPISATIEMEGSLDNRRRIFYQIGDIFYRMKPSILRVFRTAIGKDWRVS